MSARRRGATGLSGVLLVDKPAGLTSHDVVARVRRAAGEGRVGHAGTLDPMATGLLVVLVGPATRLEPYLSAAVKAYEACIVFGSATDTDDAEGQVVANAPVDAQTFDPAYATGLLTSLLGTSEQRPPAYSAIKVGGEVAHRAARSGSPLELAARSITVLRAELLGTDARACTWDVDFEVSKGTYVRALARDIGEMAGTVAHLGALRRTASGPLSVDDAVSVETIEKAGADGVGHLFFDPVVALGLPVLVVDADAVRDGRPIPTPSVETQAERYALVDASGALLAIYRDAGTSLVADAVFPVPVRGSR